MTTPRLSLTGDLQIEVDGAVGRVRAHDNVVRIDVDDPRAAARAVAGTYGGRHGVAQLTSGLALGGITVEVHGPRGLLSTLGAGVDSWVGGLVAGSRRVSAAPAALPSFLPLIPRAGRARTVAGLGIAALAFAVAVRARSTG